MKEKKLLLEKMQLRETANKREVFEDERRE